MEFPWCPWPFCALYNWVEGAAECTVVRVVANERTEGAGDENVLPSPPPCVLNPSVPVVRVPALEYVASEYPASPFVEMVGAADFAFVKGVGFSYPEDTRDGSLLEWESSP